MAVEKYNKTLILITKRYPFDTMKAPAENYLINEMKYLASKLERIYVIAADADKKDNLSVELPENVVAVRAADHNAVRMIKIFCYAVKQFFFPSEEDGESGNSIKKRIRLAYFLGKSDYYYDCIQRRFLNGGLADKENDLIIYTFWFYTYTRSAIMMKVSDCKKAKIITRAHGYDLYSERSALNYIPLREYLLKNVNLVFPCSENGSHYLKHKYPKYTRKIVTAYLGCEDYGVSEAKSDGIFTIASCSRVEPVKRIELLLNAIKYISCNNREYKIRWIHIGDGSRMNVVKRQAKGLIDDGIIIFTGIMENAKITEFYKSEKVDLFVNVSESEGLPISMMEAVSAGLPVLATDVGGVREIVDDKNGWLMAKEIDAETLAEKILEISRLEQNILYLKRRESRKKWENSFSIENNILKLLKGAFDEK